MSDLPERIKLLIQEHRQNFKNKVKEEHCTSQLLFDENGLNDIGERRFLRIRQTVDDKDYFQKGDKFYIDEDSLFIFIKSYKDCNRNETKRAIAGAFTINIDSYDTITIKTLYFDILDDNFLPQLWDEESYRFTRGERVFAKTNNYHDVFDFVNAISTYKELWKSLKSKSMKVVDFVKYKTIDRNGYDSNCLYPLVEKSIPVFSFCDDLKCEIFEIEKKRKWGAENNIYRLIRNEDNKWGIQNKETEELIIDYEFDNIAWSLGRSMVIFKKDGKEALWNVDKLEELRK